MLEMQQAACSTCSEADSPVFGSEVVVADFPEHVGALRQSEAVENQWDGDVGDLRVLRAKQQPELGDEQVLLGPDEEAPMLTDRIVERLRVQTQVLHRVQQEIDDVRVRMLVCLLKSHRSQTVCRRKSEQKFEQR